MCSCLIKLSEFLPQSRVKPEGRKPCSDIGEKENKALSNELARNY